MPVQYIKFGILGVGLLFTLVAGLNLYASWNAVQQPELIDLAAIEQGETPPSRYVRVEQYVPLPDHLFAWQYEYETATTFEIFYPIVSPNHPAADGDEPLEQFSMVVRPTVARFDGDGNPQIPYGPLEGALAIGFDALEGEEKKFLRENYPEIDVHNIHVLIPGQKPWVSFGSWIWFGFGIVVTLLGAGSFLMASDE